MADEDLSPGWAMRDGTNRSWPLRWPKRWMMWAFLAAMLTLLVVNAMSLWG